MTSSRPFQGYFIIPLQSPFNTPYHMCHAGNAWRESVSTTPRSSSGRTWLPWRRPAPCLASLSTKTRSSWWRGSQTWASPAPWRSTTSPTTSETTVLFISLLNLPWGESSVHSSEADSNSRSTGYRIALIWPHQNHVCVCVCVQVVWVHRVPSGAQLPQSALHGRFPVRCGGLCHGAQWNQWGARPNRDDGHLEVRAPPPPIHQPTSSIHRMRDYNVIFRFYSPSKVECCNVWSEHIWIILTSKRNQIKMKSSSHRLCPKGSMNKNKSGCIVIFNKSHQWLKNNY